MAVKTKRFLCFTKGVAVFSQNEYKTGEEHKKAENTWPVCCMSDPLQQRDTGPVSALIE